MAVDAHHLHHRLHAAGHHHQPATAVAAHWQANRAGAVDAPLSFPPGHHGCYGGAVAGAAVLQGQQGYGYHSSSCVGVVAPPSLAALAGADQYSQLLTLPQSGAGTTFDGTAAQQLVTHKRKRAEHSPVLDAAVLASQAHRQRMEIDRLVLNHTTKIWTGLAEQTRKYMRLVAAAVEAKASKRLQDKDEEIQKARRINWVLEERLKSVYGEAQVWRDIAQSSEAAANVLRGELEQALNTQARHGDGGAGGAADDAESCCYGENEVAPLCGEEEIGTALKRQGTTSNQSCKGCGEAVAEVLLLPCRHLCTCVSCAATVLVCPACGCAKNGTVCINFS